MKEMIHKVITVLWILDSSSGRFINFENLPTLEYPKNSEIDVFNHVKGRRLFEDDTKENWRLEAPRESEAEWSTYSVREPNGFGSFSFGFDNVFDSAGNEHFRSEERFENGTVIGGYGYTDKVNDRIIRVSYIADQRGYRARTQISPL
ncbi:uncharacterized protein [Venturia canescens]|uniref:uncharacterized protein isoform X2 n=1 Tax=Venturia canescens TaxID=32260 RepID=UPI001C9BCEA0|nr:uncharacterized protein LOC122408112 isoform X2 [Venturia canescens]